MADMADFFLDSEDYFEDYDYEPEDDYFMTRPLIPPGNIQTLMGHVDPFNLFESDIRIEEIAHSLSKQCRFTGYTKSFYSVAEHCVLASTLPSDDLLISLGAPSDDLKRVRLALLLHDAAEAYICDISRPVRKQIAKHTDILEKLDVKITETAFKKFGIPPEWYSSAWLKTIDNMMLFTEKRDLLTIDMDWGYEVPPFDHKIHNGGSPNWAERQFLLRYDYLQCGLHT